MSRKHENENFQTAFIAGVTARLESAEWGAQKRLASEAGISSSYLSDILHGRKKATEKTRRRISNALGFSYGELLKLGLTALAGDSAPIIDSVAYPLFSEDRAARIFQLAAKAVGIYDSIFFSNHALRSIRPRGWDEYTKGEIDDKEFRHLAEKEISSLQRQILEHEKREGHAG